MTAEQAVLPVASVQPVFTSNAAVKLLLRTSSGTYMLWARLLSLCTVAVVASILMAQQSRVIIYLTYDDGPDIYTPVLARWLAQQVSLPRGVDKYGMTRTVQQGIPATFFVNICRFHDANITSWWTGNCFPQPGYEDSSVLSEMVSLGHQLANHSYDHVDMTLPQLVPSDWRYQWEAEQRFIDPYQKDGHRYYRFPFLKENPAVEALINNDPYLSRMTGPIGCDFCGGGYIGDVEFAGDWDCLDPARGFTIEQCGQVYLNGIENVSHYRNEITVLLHDRIPKLLGTNTQLRLTQFILQRLPKGKYEFRALGASRGFQY
jgi:peptidoglycan/xylan/chitin deacetylase (PgdA/CDA1 family)